ncbi:MAG: T9SS type A sorting domain-containing protein [Calditrichae bacterium]|nr:T9SS type A sorting domain-containing protein [Calditrichia bacterium]NIW80074.1 T9SS type A sorting domain-containing protein [Calditrichia bacterium]
MEHYQLESEAQYIAGRIFDGVLNTLKKQHNFFESHHADTGDPYGLHTYIWTGLVARMLIDLESPPVAIELDKTSNLPKRFDLLQNYPNPFNSQTIIRFRLAKSERVTIKIYNLLGETVNTLIDENMEAGRFRVVWEGKDNHGNSVSSGLYFLQMTARSFQKTRKLILIR